MAESNTPNSHRDNHAGGMVESASASLSETKRPLLQAEDIMGLGDKIIVKLPKSPHLFMLDPLPYHKVTPWRDQLCDVRLTFQQVQKYERGSNRISASKLFQAGQALKVPASCFFEGYGVTGEEGFQAPPSEQTVNAFLLTNEGLELAQTFPLIRSAKHRRKILDLVRALADEE